MNTFPLASATSAKPAFTATTTTYVQPEAFVPPSETSASSTPKGDAPSNSSPHAAAPTTTASTESRPSSDQYTSFRCRISANSSSTSAVPMPNTAAPISAHGGLLPVGEASPSPPTIIRTTPKTTWWMCSPPGVTFFGHQETCARISRTLIRMKRNAPRKPSSRQSSGCLPGSMI